MENGRWKIKIVQDRSKWFNDGSKEVDGRYVVQDGLM